MGLCSSMAAGNKVYFISDLHLGASYIENPREQELRVVRFLRSIEGEASQLYLLGDILDYWYEYRTVVPRGYTRFFGELARLSDSGVKITWLTGNHDIWLFDYFPTELGVEVVDSPLIERVVNGRHIIMGHGDRIGKRPLGFKIICKLFRNRLCQKLYAAIHPRWTIPFAHAWSGHSRAEGGASGPSVAAVVEKEAAEVASQHPNADYIMLGHHHLMIDTPLPQSRTVLIVLGDWISNNSYAVMDADGCISLEQFEK